MKKENKHSIQISSELYDEIKEFCILNNIKTNKFIQELLKGAFMKEKYGESPFQPTVDWDINEESSKKNVHEDKNEQYSDIKSEPIENYEPITTTHLTVDVKLPDNIVQSAVSNTIIEQTSESQAIINEHMNLLNKPKKRRLK